MLDIDSAKVVLEERLHPGKMLLIDTIKGEILNDDELKEQYAGRQPYGEWLDQYMVRLKDIRIPNKKVETYTTEQRMRLMKTFGYTYEDYRNSILAMATNGAEGISAMGIDTPLAVLSDTHQPLFNYFKQLFAQVTNPPIDAIREKVVTSKTVYTGKEGNLLEDKPENCNVIKIENPILTNTDMLKLRNMQIEGYKVADIPITYYRNTSLDKALDRVCLDVDRAYREGANLLILTDKGVDEFQAPIPSLLAVSAVHQHLVRTKKENINLSNSGS